MEDVKKGKKIATKKEEEENLHAGHRQRVYAAVDKDPALDTFSEIEVLEYALFAVLPRIDTNEIAHRLLIKFGSLNSVLNAPVNSLAEVKGMSKRSAYYLRSIPAILRRAKMSKFKPDKIKNVAIAMDYLKEHFGGFDTESVYVMCFNSLDKLLGVNRVAFGGTETQSTLSIPMIVESAISSRATKIIMAHNHPNGILQPSREDIQITDLLIDSLAAVNAILSDHVIFNQEDEYVSFYNSGIIEMLYAAFDKVHGTQLSKLLTNEQRHVLSGCEEYLFNFEEMTVMKRSDYDAFIQAKYFRDMARTDFLQRWDVYAAAADDNKEDE